VPKQPSARANGPLQFVSLAAAERHLKRAAAPPDWQLTPTLFQSTLEASVSKWISTKASGSADVQSAVEQYLSGLHMGDLALASACAAGNAAAWEHFVGQYRSELYRAGVAISGGSSGRDLADSLFGELYGLRERDGSRISPFHYFHGRSKLSTWLHALLAQRHVDELRRTRNTQPIEENESGASIEAEIASPSLAPDAERDSYLVTLQAALTTVIKTLEPRDRLRLALFYAEDLTLAQVGKLTGEHESTVSRKLERTRADIRRQVESLLRQEKKMTDEQVRQCLDYAREEWPFDLTRALSARD
jgi:RNA polymerase sigma-70 factor (ECF subfamily)